jgi:hypothetical protein
MRRCTPPLPHLPLPARADRRLPLLTLALASALAPACRPHSPAPSAAAPAQPPAAIPAVAASPKPDSAVPVEVLAVRGRWRRDDGGYVLELREASPQGEFDARYFNPQPIHVGRAAWRLAAGKVQLLVELRDRGYDGSTYLLQHSAEGDRLVGTYTMPTQGQSFDVTFVRTP